MSTSTDSTLSLLNELNRLETLRAPQEHGHRRFRRFHIRGDAELHPAEGSQVDRMPIDVKLRDIGQGGVGFVCDRSLEVGSIWRCSFLMHGLPFAQQTVTIRHCHQVQAGVYLVGAQFCLDPGIMIALGLDPHELTAARDSEQSMDDNAFQSPGMLDADADGDGNAENTNENA